MLRVSLLTFKSTDLTGHLINVSYNSLHNQTVKHMPNDWSPFFLSLPPRAGGSVDTELDRIHLHLDTPCAKSSKKSVFGSIERGMDKLKCMLTPKKRINSASDGPRKVKVRLHGYMCTATFLWYDMQLKCSWKNIGIHNNHDNNIVRLYSGTFCIYCWNINFIAQTYHHHHHHHHPAFEIQRSLSLYSGHFFRKNKNFWQQLLWMRVMFPHTKGSLIRTGQNDLAYRGVLIRGGLLHFKCSRVLAGTHIVFAGRNS